MEENKAPPGKYRLSDRIESVLISKHLLTNDNISELKPIELEEMRQIALGEIPGVNRGDRSKALFTISRKGSDQGSEILNKVLADSKENVDLRIIAAANLGLLSTEYAESKLVANLNAENDLVQNEVIKSLGRIGNIKALNALDNISSAERPDFVQRQLAFAKALISYRLGIDRDDISFIEGARRTLEREKDFIELQIRQMIPDNIKESLQLLKGSRYGINLSNNLGLEISAGKSKWKMFVNKEFDKGDILPQIRENKMITGLVALWSEETGTYSVQYVVLTRPQSDIIDIMIIRTDGKIFFSGHGLMDEDKIVFSIFDIEQPGSISTWIEGRLSPKGLEIDKALMSSRRRGKRITTEFTGLIQH